MGGGGEGRVQQFSRGERVQRFSRRGKGTAVFKGGGGWVQQFSRGEQFSKGEGTAIFKRGGGSSLQSGGISIIHQFSLGRGQYTSSILKTKAYSYHISTQISDNICRKGSLFSLPGQPILQGESGVFGLRTGLLKPAQPMSDAMDVGVDRYPTGRVPGHVHHQQRHLGPHTWEGHLVTRKYEIIDYFLSMSTAHALITFLNLATFT